jgi:hypothetical protein
MVHQLFGLRTALVVVLLFCDSPFAIAAQRPSSVPEESAATRPAEAQIVVTNDQDARETRADFENVLKRLPPAVGRVLRLDPSLMRNAAYLAPYPTLSAFLQSHPAVVQNPAYYLENIEYEFWHPRAPEDARSQTIRAWQDMMQALAFVLIFSGVAAVTVWVIKTLVEHRRWLRTSRVQTEVHTKLLDRFSSNDELMAYMQTPSGRRFLESAPLPIEGPSRAAAAPLFALGVLVLALGTGFVVSAAASFLVSRRLGLLDSPETRREQTTVTGG